MQFKPLPLEEEFIPLSIESKPDEFRPLPISSSSKVVEGGEFKSLPLETSRDVKPVEEPPFSAKHPNLHGLWRGGVVETAKDFSKVSFLKLIYPEEREKFKNLTGHGKDAKWYQAKTKKQAQVRDLLLKDLEFAAFSQFGNIAKGAKNVLTPALKRYLPKTYEMLTKRIGGAVAETVVEGAEKAVEKTPVQKVVDAIKKAKPVRAEQEALYTKARGAKIAEAVKAGAKVEGEAGYYAKLSKMKGKLPRAEFHSIREQVGQADIDALFAQVNDHATIGEFEKLSAGKGLAKLFGEFGGSVPTKGELGLLKSVFGEEFTKKVLSKRSLWAKAKEAGLELANIPRAIMASFDVSAPLRQGVFLIGRQKQFAPAFGSMFKYLFSEKSYAALAENIAKRPTYKLMKKTGLSITELGGNLANREEQFMSSWAEKIPLIGHGVRVSGRAYTGFLNKLRADVFDDLVKKGTELGIKDPKYLKDVANFINHATGRGSLGGLESAAVQLNATFFSPRLIASRLGLLNPAFYTGLQPQARKEAIKSLLTFTGAASTVASLAVMGGAKVGLDPRSADFMKIKVGNTRYDILGGFQQPVRAAAQIISGKVVSSTTGKEITLGEGYRSLTRTEIISRFAESKEAPVMSLATALLRGKTGIGEKVDVPTEVANRFIPMVMQDMKDLYDEKGLVGIPMASPALFGVGVMSYGGVASYGLKGKDYPSVNTELNRLKTSMGYPSTVAFGYELTNPEYKRLKKATGVEIAKNLNDLFSRPEYQELEDKFKVKRIEMFVDWSKDNVKNRMFPEKRKKSMIVSGLKATQGLSDSEAKKETEKRFMED